MRGEPVVQFGERPEPGPLRRVMDVLQAVLGKTVSFVDVCMLFTFAGTTVTDAAASPGTALTVTRNKLDFQDAGIDSVRVVVRGQNSAVGTVDVQVYNTTQSVEMCKATLSGTSEQTVESSWQVFKPLGGDEQFEVRVIGDGVFDPILFSVHLQARTTQRRV